MRLVVISDIHGNFPALEKAFSFIDKLKIDGIIWCGDYITDVLFAPEVLRFIREKCCKYKSYIVKGNREDYIINYYKNRTFGDACVTGSLLYTYNSLSSDDLNYIMSLPNEVIVDLPNCPKIYVSHKINNNSNYKYNVFGHIHKQCLFFKDEKVFINPGSVGQPYSGVPGLEFGILELIDSEWSSHFYHMSYDIDSLIKFISSSDLINCDYHWDKVLIKSLKTGKGYIDYYINGVKSTALKCGVDNSDLSKVPIKIWNYIYDKLEIDKKS